MILALSSLLLSNLQEPRAGEEPDGNKLVKVELVSERAKLHPGERFTLAAKLTVTPRWHIYWGENPGETGVPTRVEIEAPKEFTVGPPRFPVPERHVEEGPLLTYIHEGQVLVLFDAVAPEKLEPGSKVHFALSASWLVCTTRCFQGEGEAELELECAPKGEPLKQNEALFTEARAKLPRPLAELKGLSTALNIDAGKPDECHFTISVADAVELRFMPADQRNPAFDTGWVENKGKGPILEALYRWKEPPKGKAQIGCPGILSVTIKGEPVHYWFDRKYDVGS